MSENEFYAHSLPGKPESAWQRLREHLENCAQRAAEFASAFGASDWGHVAGLWHDMGKYSREFQSRICATGGEEAHVEAVGKVDHSTAGAQHAARRLGHAGKALAYVIAGHHGGLPDGLSADSCLRSRLEKTVPDYCHCPQDLMDLRPPTLPIVPVKERAGVQFSLFIRMLYSCLVDADFLDTEAFVNAVKHQSRGGYDPLAELAPLFFARLEELRSQASASEVNRQRETILRQCLSAAEWEPGLFSLTVPTGGGKTLSSMAFALRHALKHGLRRIIYVIPFTSIIEQNAGVFRSMLGEDAVLEHHSNFEPAEEDHRSRLAGENWDAPVIVTTNVQFFESLFANRSSRCRKLHNIAGSVVILDEVQTLPAPYLLACLEVLRELTATYRTSVVLCSATPPAVAHRSDFPRGLTGVREIVEAPQALADALKRTTVTILPQTRDAELVERCAGCRQVLCIVNTRRHAKTLYSAMKHLGDAYHLSALMCPVHRSQILEEIRTRLREGLPVRVVSTQLIEAGVDIDFPVVLRSLAGIDSIAQAAGRCNREGRLDTGRVYVFTPEHSVPSGHFRQTSQAAESVLRRHNDPLSLAAIEDYFREYYWMKGDGLDERGILTLLQEGCSKGDFPFKTVAEEFRFIQEDTRPVIIPFDEDARHLIEALACCEHPASVARRLQKYSVSVYPHEWNRLLSTGSIELKTGMFPVLIDEALYREDVGLITDDSVAREPESLFV
ncbi:MAG TPA: CRISPR-associated helicase Cas3' [Sedimentisphaerales bacterium]|nr:CRISPR-associated helicase Cas3' [Sedimentisphaerales bacterium]